MPIITQLLHPVLHQMVVAGDVSPVQRRFLAALLPSLLRVRGKINFLNLSRYGSWSERTLRRQFRQAFDWVNFNRRTLDGVFTAGTPALIALDASFVPKSGKKTYGLDRFFNGCAGQVQKGLEVSLVSLIEVSTNTAYALSVRQTPPSVPTNSTPTVPTNSTPTVPTNSTPTRPAIPAVPAAPTTATRMDFYLEHLVDVVAHADLPPHIRYAVFDGAFAHYKFVAGVCALDLHLISKLRCDANLRYLYDGPQHQRGARRKYGDKVAFNTTHLQEHWCDLGQIEPHLHLYTVLAYHQSLKRVLRVLLLLCDKDPAKPRYVLLFSTDPEIAGADIYRFYKARFQMEFLFRDAKQWCGLSDCQARDQAALHFHFNASLSTLNLVKLAHRQESRTAPGAVLGAAPTPFSMASWKHKAFNQHLLDLFIANLDLEPSWVQSQPGYAALCHYGAIAP